MWMRTAASAGCSRSKMEIFIYCSYTGSWTEERVIRAAQSLPPLRRERMERYQRWEDRRESAAAALLTAYALLAAEKEPPGPPQPTVIAADDLLTAETAAVSLALDWTPGEGGKPFEQGLLWGKTRRFVSLSHTRGAVAAAVADQPVGVDIERLDAAAPHTVRAILRRFHPLERELLEPLAEEQLADRFPVWWTLKESVMKLTGQGFRLPLSMFYVLPETPPDEKSPAGREIFTGCWSGGDIRLYSWPLSPYRLSVAFEKENHNQ